MTTRAPAIACLLVMVLSGVPVSSNGGGQWLPAAAFPEAIPLASGLCESDERPGYPLLLVGPRLRVSRTVNAADETRVSQEWLELVRAHPTLHFATAGSWVSIHDVESGRVFKRNCANPSGVVMQWPERPLHVAISNTGDVAAALPRGRVYVLFNAESGLAQPSVLDGGVETPVEALLWYGRRLVIGAANRIALVDFDFYGKTAERKAVSTPVEPSAGDIAHAFVYNGMTYVLRGRCLDVHVGPGLAPRLRQAACLPVNVERPYLLVDRSSLRVLDAAGRLAWQGARPSVMMAQLSGTTHEVANALVTLSRAEWLSRVPIAARASAVSPFWSQRFTRDWWSDATSFNAAMAVFDARGWRHLFPDGEWYGGPGVAFRPRSGFGFVKPQGRTLAQLSRDVYQDNGYSNAQVAAIVARNSDLADKLEGRLVQAGWAPIAALARSKGAPARVFEPLAAVTGSEPLGQCRGEQSTDKRLADALRRGVVVASALPRALVQAIGEPDSIEIRADAVMVSVCDNWKLAAAASGGRLLVLPSPRLRIRRNNAIQSLTKGTVRADGLTFSASADVDWPIAVAGNVAIGFASSDSSTLGSATRSWLDQLLPHYKSELYVPVTAIDVALVVEAGATPMVTIPAVSLASAEVTPSRARSAARASGCTAADAAARRLVQETLIGLDRFPRDSRSVSVHVGVAEHSVPLLDPVFDRESGVRIWVTPNQDDVLEMVRPPLPENKLDAARPLKDRNHGMNIAALLAAQSNLTGLLKDVDLVWIDLQDPPDDNRDILGSLAARRSIVNVSQQLDHRWAPFEVQARAAWSQRLLFVAAAANEPGGDHGFPLRWRASAKANIIGVGVAQADRSIAANATYDRESIDLLAPGLEVPSLDETGAIECDNGTSFASVYVSAVAALLANDADGFGIGPIRARLLATASWRPDYAGRVKGGLVDASRALQFRNANRLTVERAGQTPLELRVDINRAELLTVTPTSGETGSLTMPWESVLRLHRLEPAAGGDRYRVAFVQNRRFVVLDDVIVSASAKVPVTRCRRAASDEVVECFDVAVTQITDYVAKMSNLEIVEF
jgi:hypothetical protein